jgi:hypothetical protein
MKSHGLHRLILPSLSGISSNTLVVENKSAQTKMRSSRSKAVEGEGKNREEKSVYLFERAKSYEV